MPEEAVKLFDCEVYLASNKFLFGFGDCKKKIIIICPDENTQDLVKNWIKEKANGQGRPES